MRKTIKLYYNNNVFALMKQVYTAFIATYSSCMSGNRNEVEACVQVYLKVHLQAFCTHYICLTFQKKITSKLATVTAHQIL